MSFKNDSRALTFPTLFRRDERSESRGVVMPADVRSKMSYSI